MVANALIAWPVVFSASSYVLRVAIDGVAQDRTFSVTPNRFYWVTTDGQADASTLGGVGDLMAILRTCIQSHTASPTVTCTLDANWRMRVTLTGGGSTIQLLWAHANTTLDTAVNGANPFGYSGDTSAASAVVSASMPMGLWRPGYPIWNDGRPQRPMIGGVGRSLAGRSRVSDFGTASRERPIYFGRLRQAQVLEEYAASTALWGTLEHAWHNALGLGQPFRLYEDESTLASGSSAYTLWRIASKLRPYERLGNDPPESLYWRARILGTEVT